MKVTSLNLVNFRNFSRLNIEFNPKGCLISGDNGSGKSNLLEAIAYSAFGRSVRNFSDQDLVSFESQFFYNKTGFSDDGEALSFEISFQQNSKSVKLNNRPISKLSELYKHVKIVYFSPDDIGLVNNTPRIRRNFIDTSCSQNDWEYLHLLREYQKILQQRNALLKSEFDDKLKRIWDTKLYTNANEIIKRRMEYCRRLEFVSKQICEALTDSKEQLTLCYKSTLPIDMNQNELAEFLYEKEKREVEQGHTIFGPHLDDVIIRLDDRFAKEFASQGQKRSIAISMKLAQAKLIREQSKSFPILIFDDILSELDEKRTTKIIELVGSEHQVFIATPNAQEYEAFNLPKIVLKDGYIIETE